MQPGQRALNRFNTFSRVLLILIFLLTGCKRECDQNKIIDYITQVQTIHDQFTELNNLSLNHPELRSKNVTQMNVLLDDFEAQIPQLCVKELSKKVLKAMNSSITYLDPAEDVFYYPYQLAKFAMDDWQAVDEAIKTLQNSNP